MSSFSIEDRTFCVIAYFENGRSPTLARRAFTQDRKIKTLRMGKCPTVQNIRNWAMHFEATGTVGRKIYTKLKSARRIEAEHKVAKALKKNPGLSIRQCAATLGLSRATAARIMREIVTEDPDLALRMEKASARRGDDRVGEVHQGDDGDEEEEE